MQIRINVYSLKTHTKNKTKTDNPSRYGNALYGMQSGIHYIKTFSLSTSIYNNISDVLVSGEFIILKECIYSN